MVDSIGSAAVTIRDHFGASAEATHKMVTAAATFAADLEKAGAPPSAEVAKQAREMVSALDGAGSAYVIAGLAAGADESSMEASLKTLEKVRERVSVLAAAM